MEPILGIDLGTTNSAVAVVRDGQPQVLRDAQGNALLPSAVGLDPSGELLLGQPARNQAIVYPERTILSVKRRMGEDVHLSLGDQSFTPQEISALLLKHLKAQAEQQLAQPIRKAVITVPAFFKDAQRQATQQAGELAGLEVVRIINEPTAATLVYEAGVDQDEHLIVYDLGGGTFDVSIVRTEAGVIEVLSSCGDTRLGGDDFDQRLLDLVADRFLDQHGLDLREHAVARSRLLRAAEQAKIQLSSEASVEIAEEFIAEHDGQPLHLNTRLDRNDYEELIEPLVERTIRSVDEALREANLQPNQIDKILLVGGSTRTPLVQQRIREEFGREPHREIDPDLCVAVGAAVQGAMIAGVDVGPVLVDVTAHTLGIDVLDFVGGLPTDDGFSPIIHRNTPLPAIHAERYMTTFAGQEKVKIQVRQGESPSASQNQPVGTLWLTDLDETAEAGSPILVRFKLDLNGVLEVTAVEQRTNKQKTVTIESAITRFRDADHDAAKDRLTQMFPSQDLLGLPQAEQPESEIDQDLQRAAERGEALIERALQIRSSCGARDAAEIDQQVASLRAAIDAQQRDQIEACCDELDDQLFYLQD